MVICNHIIKDNQIVGIGVLFKKSVGTSEAQLLYGSYCLYFYVHLLTVSILIESDTLSSRGYTNEILEKDKKQIRRSETVIGKPGVKLKR